MASSSTGEQHWKLKTTSGRMVNPTHLRPVGTGFTGHAAPNINKSKSRFSCWISGSGTVQAEGVQVALSDLNKLFLWPKTQDWIRRPALGATLVPAVPNCQQHRRLGEQTVRDFALYQVAQRPHKGLHSAAVHRLERRATAATVK